MGPRSTQFSQCVIFIDADLVMRTNVQKMVSRCFTVLRQQRTIRHSVPATTFKTLIILLILSRLDYGNAVLVSLPVYTAYLFQRLQSVMNAAAWLIYGLRHSEHISNALILHWLWAHKRLWFKMAMLIYEASRGTAPSYFPVAGPTLWNSLPDNVISVPSLSTFHQHLKHFCSKPHSLTLSSIPWRGDKCVPIIPSPTVSVHVKEWREYWLILVHVEINLENDGIVVSAYYYLVT